jgi:hypothetical protein
VSTYARIVDGFSTRTTGDADLAASLTQPQLTFAQAASTAAGTSAYSKKNNAHTRR